jgi:ribosomal protein S12 methylthiotransferase
MNLIGQDTSYYGADRYGRPRLPELLERLSRVPGIRWIRLLYAHPAHVTEDLIRVIRDCPPVVKYIDLPMQHINGSLLTAMRRETDGATIRRIVDRFRSQIPDLAIRTTFIVGFPGETDAHLEELARFMEEVRFERLGIFPYSPEPKTPASSMPDPVPDAVKEQRFRRLMELQQEISQEINRRWLGREVEVLIDERDPSDPNVFLGRSYADAPEVDGQVFVRSSVPLSAGQFVRAKVVDTTEYDLVGEALKRAT